MKKECSELKKRALLAKQRMRLGYWDALRAERERVLREVGENEETKFKISEYQRAKLRRDTDLIVSQSPASVDEALYERVCRILDADEDTTNPIGQLIDQETYRRLDDGGRQRYILELSKKYRELRERYYEERMSKTC